MTTPAAVQTNSNTPPDRDRSAPEPCAATDDRLLADFGGAVVAHFESRLPGAMDSLIRRHGGVSWSAPALSEVPVTNDPDLPVALRHLASREFDLVVLLTGVGTRRLFSEAERAGVLHSVRDALATMTVVCRGPKPAAVLRQHEIRVRHLVAEPHTTAELLAYLAQLPVAGSRALILSAGEKMPEPSAFLSAHGGGAIELQLYRWDLSESDAARLAETVVAINAGAIDVVAFTTQVQVRHLFNVAARSGDANELARVLSERVFVGAVGPTCADALRERNVEPDLVPAHPKMGHLVVEMARLSPRSAGLAENRREEPGGR